MTWAQRFHVRQSLAESLWVIPLLGAMLGGLLGILVSFADEQIGTLAVWQYSPSTASTFLSAIVGATAALTGFVVTVTVLVIQMATGTFSARIMRLIYRDWMLKATLAVLIGTFTYSFSVLQRIEDDFVPDLGVTLAGFFISLSLLVFIVFFDRFIRQLKPVAVAASVASDGSLDVRANRAHCRSHGHPVGAPDDARGSDTRRASQPRRRDPSCRSRRSRQMGSRA